jgi:hypothetical protein
MKKILLNSLLLVSFMTMAQTNVSGGIFSNTTFSLNNSPYIITDHLVLFPNVRLTIEPGVVLKFVSNKYFEIRGELIAIGTNNSRIIFTSNSATPDKGDWSGIQIKNSLGAKASFQYCDFKYTSSSNNAECCFQGGPIYYNHCKFENNVYALIGYTGYDINIDNSEFNNNTYAITAADKVITNCVFTNNTYGLYQTERIDVNNSTFTNNGTALYGGRGLLQNSTITNNTVGVDSFYEGFEIRNNIISNNGVGLKTSNYSGSVAVIKNNKICNNTTYNVENKDNINKDLTQNCWCIENQSEIESKLKDGYDDISLGLFNYSIYNSVCNLIINSIIKYSSPLSTDDFISILEKAIVYPNPTYSDINVKLSENTDKLEVQLYDATGKLVFVSDYMNIQDIKLNLNELNQGNYILNLISSKEKIIKKIIKK